MHTLWADSAPRALGSALPPSIPKYPHAVRAQSYNCMRQLWVASRELLCSLCGVCPLLPVADVGLVSSRKLVESFSCYSNGLREKTGQRKPSSTGAPKPGEQAPGCSEGLGPGASSSFSWSVFRETDGSRAPSLSKMTNTRLPGN